MTIPLLVPPSRVFPSTTPPGFLVFVFVFCVPCPSQCFQFFPCCTFFHFPPDLLPNHTTLGFGANSPTFTLFDPIHAFVAGDSFLCLAYQVHPPLSSAPCSESSSFIGSLRLALLSVTPRLRLFSLTVSPFIPQLTASFGFNIPTLVKTRFPSEL